MVGVGKALVDDVLRRDARQQRPRRTEIEIDVTLIDASAIGQNGCQ